MRRCFLSQHELLAFKATIASFRSALNLQNRSFRENRFFFVFDVNFSYLDSSVKVLALQCMIKCMIKCMIELRMDREFFNLENMKNEVVRYFNQ